MKHGHAGAATATAVGGKTARACDSCVGRRARWYCAPDDAFLCQHCDAAVHSANPLARRHHRVRLQAGPASEPEKPAPAWHHGFRRKARTPRPSKARPGGGGGPPPSVPEVETSCAEEEQLMYRVPVFDPVVDEFCMPASNGEFLAGFVQSDAELAEFAADMESLLGRGLDAADSFSMEELGLVDATYVMPEESGQVKDELDTDANYDLSGETLEINFDEEQEETTAEDQCRDGRKIGLTLDYEAIADQWSANGRLSPWMDGERPQHDRWLDDVVCAATSHGSQWWSQVGRGGQFGEGREARVSRYREKRRLRLFSKKIRYEVRKLNAEKRPRMKGRFVKRLDFAPAASGSSLEY